MSRLKCPSRTIRQCLQELCQRSWPAPRRARADVHNEWHRLFAVLPRLSHEFASADLLVKLPGGIHRRDSQFIAELPLALMVLVHSQMGLIQAGVAAHELTVYVSTAQLAGNEALAQLDALSVVAEFEVDHGCPVERLKMLHPQLFAVEQHPFLERRIVEQVAPV